MSEAPNDPLAPRPLPVLRAMIDAVDHEVLQLLSQRNAIVAEVAAYKRAHRGRIRDHQREREVLDDRRARATPLGLNPDTIESMWRLVLWASRDRQAALRAEVPPDIEPRSVAIIGGSGQMGRCLAGLFGDLGHPVMIADVDTSLRPVDAAGAADVVIISVPIDETVRVIAEIGPHVRDDALLADVTSTKSAPVAAMLEHSRGSVVGLHPLFGPSVHSLQGQRVALTPGRGEAWAAWMEQMLGARGLQIVRTTPEAHDEAMAVVQVLTHFMTEVSGLAMATLDHSLEETLAFSSPVYLMELLMTARHFGQSADLYGAIQMSNPSTPAVTDAVRQAAERLHAIVNAGDRAALNETFETVRAYFGDFTLQAMEQSSFLIDRLVERA